MSANTKKVSILFLIIAIAAAYYFAIYNPKERSLAKERECQEAERSFIAQSDASTSTREYAYDKVSGRCLYKGSFKSASTIHEYIKDAQTNDVINEYMAQSVNGEFFVTYGDQSEFIEMSGRYFIK